MFAVAAFLACSAGVSPAYSETIVVTAERLEQTLQESAAAITVLRREDLLRVAADDLAGALRLAPGLQLIAVNPGAPPMISSRGFFGAGEVEYLQLLIDGAPAGDVESGLADWRSIPIESIDRIEILRGPGSSLFGDTALGGVVQVFRRKDSHLSVSGGSFGTARLSAAYAGNSIHAVRSDGFREHSASRETFGHAGFEWGRARFSFDASDRSRNDPGPAGSEELFRFDREETRRLRAAVRYGGPFEVTVHAQHRAGEQVRTLLLAPGFGDRASRDIETTALGIAATRSVPIATRGRIAGGVDLGHDSLTSAYGERASRPQSPGVSPGDSRGRGSRIRQALFLTAEWRLTPNLRLAAGGRWDRIDDSFEDTGATDTAFSPRIGLSLDLGSLTTYAQLSRAFKAPTLDQRFDQRPFPDFAGGTFTISNAFLVPQRARNAEIGIRARWWEAAIYQTDVEDEIDFDIRTFRYANIGRSRHRGFEGAVRAGLARVAYTWTRVEPAAGESRSRQLKNIAEHIIRGDFAIRAFVDVHMAVEYSAGRFLDDANRFPLDDATVVDLKISKPLARAITAAIEARNVFDQRYAPLGFALGDVPFYYPAAGRSITASLSWTGGTR